MSLTRDQRAICVLANPIAVANGFPRRWMDVRRYVRHRSDVITWQDSQGGKHTTRDWREVKHEA